jgi:hypothetical protein
VSAHSMSCSASRAWAHSRHRHPCDSTGVRAARCLIPRK